MPEQKLSLPGVPPKTEIANNLGSAKRAVIYTRVSTGDQHAETQLYDLRELAKQRRFEIVHEYTDTISGAKSKRPGLDQLLADAQRHRFDVVLVAAFYRVARSVRRFLEVLDELSHLNIEFVSLRENIDTGGPLGRAMVVIENRARAEDAQLKSNQTVEMVGLGRLELPTYGLGNRRSIHLSYSPEASQASDYHRQYMGCEPSDGSGHEAVKGIQQPARAALSISDTCVTIASSPHLCPQIPPFGGRYESHPSLCPDWNWCPDRIADRGAVFHSGEPVQAHD